VGRTPERESLGVAIAPLETNLEAELGLKKLEPKGVVEEDLEL